MTAPSSEPGDLKREPAQLAERSRCSHANGALLDAVALGELPRADADAEQLLDVEVGEITSAVRLDHDHAELGPRHAARGGRRCPDERGPHRLGPTPGHAERTMSDRGGEPGPQRVGRKDRRAAEECHPHVLHDVVRVRPGASASRLEQAVSGVAVVELAEREPVALAERLEQVSVGRLGSHHRDTGYHVQPGPRSLDLMFDERRTSTELQRELGVDLDATREPVVVAGRYELEDRLGSGAFGVVYRARDRQLPRHVAIKVVDKAGYGEALSLARVQHPHLLRLYDYGTGSDYGYLVLEHLVGETLDAWLALMPRRAEVLARFREVALGLSALHAAGFVHRDVKPSNIMVVDGRAVVVDFGLAHRVGEQTTTCGTLRYMAPEQLLEQAVDARSDQFAFCVALWEALAGREPFRRSSAAGRLERIIEGPVGFAPGPRPVARALRRGLALAPTARHPSMLDIADALERRPPWLAMAAALVLAVAVGHEVGAGSGVEVGQVAQTLELAEQAESARDHEGALRYLEAARHRARRDGHEVELRAVAAAASDLAEQMVSHGEMKLPLECWAIASDILLGLGDMQGVAAIRARVEDLRP